MPGFEPGRRLIARIPSTTLRVCRRLVAIEQGEHRVEVHVGAILGHDGRDDPVRRALLEQRPGDLLDHPCRRPLRHPDRDRAVADDLDIAALERREPEVVSVEPVVVTERRVPELESWPANIG